MAEARDREGAALERGDVVALLGRVVRVEGRDVVVRVDELAYDVRWVSRAVVKLRGDRVTVPSKLRVRRV